MKYIVTLAFLCCTGLAFGQSNQVNNEDYSWANSLKKKWKDDSYAGASIVQKISFDRGKNELKLPVVVATEQGTAEFIAIKDIALFQYYEFHNQFIKLKSFKRYDKYLNRYSLSGKAGYDRSLTDDNIFFDDSRVQFYSFRFMERGRMAKVEYEKEYTDAKYLTRFFFHEDYPIVEKTIEFRVPKWLDLEVKEINFAGYTVTKTVTSESKYTVYTYKVKDLPAVKSEAKDLGIAYTHPHIIVQTKSFDNGGEKVSVFTDTKDLYNWYNQLYKITVNESPTLKQQADKLIAGKTSDEEKVKAIYYWVQDNIRYIAYEDGYAGYVPTSAQEVLSSKYGDCKGMANLLTEMLKTAGFDAHYTWIGTRHIPYDHSVPAMCVDNHAISTLYLKGKEYFLDGTESYAPFGENAYRIQGKSALIEKGATFDEKKVPLTTGDLHKIKTQASLNLGGDVLKGKVKVTFTGNERTDFHQIYQDLPLTAQEDFLKNLLEFGNDNLSASNVKTSDLKNREIPVSVEGEIDLSNNINTIGGDKYVSIDFFPKNLSSYMPDDKRTRGYDFESVYAYEDEMELTLPADRKSADLPEPLNLDAAGYSFSGAYEVKGNKLVLKKTLTIKNSTIEFKDIEPWKKFLEQIREFNRNLVTITKNDKPVAAPAATPAKPAPGVRPTARPAPRGGAPGVRRTGNR
jgi:transglutaminase-like putative cysteine protease